MKNLITPKEALHQSSWQVIAKRFDLNDISTTRSLLEEAHRIILEQDRLIDSYELMLKKHENTVKERRFDPYLKRFVEGKSCADKNDYHSSIGGGQ